MLAYKVFLRETLRMGRVLNHQELTDPGIPTKEDFVAAKSLFEEHIEVAIAANQVRGAFIFGSMAVGLVGPRSDFDNFICLQGRSNSALFAVNCLAKDIRENSEGRIPFAPIIQRAEALQEGRHEMDRLFGQHLSGPHRLVYGEDPAGLITYSPQPVHEIMGGYLFNKRRKLTDAYVGDWDDGVTLESGLQRLLELPFAVGRKAVQAAAEAHLLQDGVENSADKEAVLSKALPLMAEVELDEFMTELLQANAEYDETIARIQGGERAVKREYEHHLQSLFSRLPRALNWLEGLERKFLPLLK